MSDKMWRLMVFDVPDRFGGLLARHRFRPTQKNPNHWWRLFDPARPDARGKAEKVLADLKKAGLGSKWTKVDRLQPGGIIDTRIVGPSRDPRTRRRQMDQADSARRRRTR